MSHATEELVRDALTDGSTLVDLGEHRLRDLAEMVSSITGAKIDYVDNPRNEAAENDLFVENRQFLEMGLDPITLEVLRHRLWMIND